MEKLGERFVYSKVCKIHLHRLSYIFGDNMNGTDEGTSFYSDTASDEKIFYKW